MGVTLWDTQDQGLYEKKNEKLVRPEQEDTASEFSVVLLNGSWNKNIVSEIQI